MGDGRGAGTMAGTGSEGGAKVGTGRGMGAADAESAGVGAGVGAAGAWTAVTPAASSRAARPEPLDLAVMSIAI